MTACETENGSEFYIGTLEYLNGGVKASLVITDADVIEVSFDRGVTWKVAEWVGPTGMTRKWRILLGAVNPLPAAGLTTVYVRITDNPEVPIIKAGQLTVSKL